MLLDLVSDGPTLEDAARNMAGNWKSWRWFVWFYSDEIPNNQNVCLGYLVNNADPSVKQLANSEVVMERLKPWMGKSCLESLVGPFGSSLHGDKDVLGGIQIRVYDDAGKITEPFKILYELGVKFREEDGVLDQERYKAVNKREFVRWLTLELPDLCEQFGVEYTDTLPTQVFETLDQEENGDFDYFSYEDVAELIEEMGEES